MNSSDRNDPTRQPTNEIRGPAGERVRDQTGHPGGVGSKERIAAKGNDLTNANDHLQRDIEQEVNDHLEEGQDDVPDSRRH